MILDKILEQKRIDVDAQMERLSFGELEELVAHVEAPRDFRAELRREGISLIAEIKRASPSRGDILPDMDILALAEVYEQSGARALSVLTDGPFFKGSLDDLRAVHRHTRIPTLRKEFIIDPYQIYEARAAGADAILLIVRVLADEELRDFHRLATKLGMSALVETHNEAEIGRALDAGAHIIGINNRDLDTLEVDVQNSLHLKKMVPGGVVLVSESGIHTREHVRLLEDGGADAILVGESLLSSNDIRAKIVELLKDADE